MNRIDTIRILSAHCVPLLQQKQAFNITTPQGRRAFHAGLREQSPPSAVGSFVEDAHDRGKDTKEAVLETGLQAMQEMDVVSNNPEERELAEQALIEHLLPKKPAEPELQKSAELALPHAPATPKSKEQADAGNYKKAHVRLHGLDITIENAKGQVRRGVDGSGKKWESTLHAHYGYITGHEKGRDGDHVDVFIGPDEQSELVYVVNQITKGGRFDEHKVMLGYTNLEDAAKGYLANYEDGWTGMGDIVAMTVPQFRHWLKHEDVTKPCLPLTKEAAAKWTPELILRAVALPQGELKPSHIKGLRLYDTKPAADMKPGEVRISRNRGRPPLVALYKDFDNKLQHRWQEWGTAEKVAAGLNDAGIPVTPELLNHEKEAAASTVPTEKVHTELVETCPHCQKQIHEKGYAYRDDKWYHRGCPEPIDRTEFFRKVDEQRSPEERAGIKRWTQLTNKEAADEHWVGVDLDSTLAMYRGWKGHRHIGDPIPKMVDRVKRWRRQGLTVKIFTARVAGDNGKARQAIENWCREVFGEILPITNRKDQMCLRIWDDRARAVYPNTGIKKHAAAELTTREMNGYPKNKAEVLQHLPKQLWKTVNGVSVYLVDGNYIEKHLDMEFIEGSNWQANANYVPDHEIWIDQHIDEPTREHVLEHELAETKKMQAGAPYREAHYAANRVERKVIQVPNDPLQKRAFVVELLQKQAITAGQQAAAQAEQRGQTFTNNTLNTIGNDSEVPLTVAGAGIGGLLGGAGSIASDDPQNPSMRRAAVLALLGAAGGAWAGHYMNQRKIERDKTI